MLFASFTKQVISTRRLTVLSLSFQLVFPGLVNKGERKYLDNNYKISRKKLKKNGRSNLSLTLSELLCPQF